MKTRLFAFLLATLLATLTTSAEPSATVASGPDREEVLRSILVRQDAVYASCPRGLYRASTTDKKWVPLKVDAGIPPGGIFAKAPSANSALYYYTPQWIRRDTPSNDNRTFGLYRFDPVGETWRLLSSEYDHTDVFVGNDDTLYALVAMTEKRDRHTISYNRILRSTDSGAHWEDISHGVARGVELARIFQDPDHPDLVCLSAYGLRAYVLQANDKSYQWVSTREWDWYPKHSPLDWFFCNEYSGTQFTHRATLSNYFDAPFGSRVEIPSFQITVGGGREFKPKESVRLPVEITFLHEWDTSATLLDTDQGHVCWGLFRILPDGTQQVIPIAKGVVRESPEVSAHRLTHRQSYGRTLDLSEMCEFSQPGTYRVQLLYDDGWIADKDKEAWQGSFRSLPFEITIAQ